MDRILVVDDDRSIRGVVCEVLRDDGYRVEEAASAEEAIDRHSLSDFDLVITDIRMPGLDGIALLQRIRERNDDAHVVIMTSHASLQSAVSALKQGAYDYLIKPFDSLEVISEVAQRALASQRLTRERKVLVSTLTRSNEELEKLNCFFRELAIRDGLTGLFNHRYLHEVLKSEVERARRYSRPLSVIFIDVDHFKRYNDTHGHQRGDEVLRLLAQLLREQVRETDVVARWGGEEFVVVAPETELAEGAQLAEKLRERVAQFPFHGRETQPGGRLTISAGVAELRSEPSEEALVSRADRAAYRAKNRGRNSVYIAA